jgi:hypothetical protein
MDQGRFIHQVQRRSGQPGAWLPAGPADFCNSGFSNSDTGLYAYMMVTSSGGRVELRQVGSSNIYESQDSTYTQLDVSDPNALLLRTKDGTRYKFVR